MTKRMLNLSLSIELSPETLRNLRVTTRTTDSVLRERVEEALKAVIDTTLEALVKNAVEDSARDHAR